MGHPAIERKCACEIAIGSVWLAFEVDLNVEFDANRLPVFSGRFELVALNSTDS